MEPNNITFLKQGISYSASRVSENGMWDHAATPQDVFTSVRMLKGPVAQNFRNGDVGPLTYTVTGWRQYPT